jgi:hypothetical protein
MTKPTTTATGLTSASGGADQTCVASFFCRIRHWLTCSLPAGLLFLCGCQTSTQSLFITTGPDWHIQQGQALWRPKSGLPEFGGDLVLARDDAGNCLIQFDKTPMAILSAQTTTNRWLIKFPQRAAAFQLAVSANCAQWKITAQAFAL